MIISASRRTDIPAIYSEWFYNRLKAGYFLVPNPYNPNRISRIEISPTNVDCIVFWTKNPVLMLDKLTKIDELGYNYFFQFTLTGYDQKLEPRIPEVKERIRLFKELSKKLGRERVIWRYDPIIINDDYPLTWHLKRFTYLANELESYTNRCIISFVDVYRKKQFRTIADLEMKEIGKSFSKIVEDKSISLFTCAEAIDLSEYGILPASCIDDKLISQIIGYDIMVEKDTNQRKRCGCVKSIDVGAYNTCDNGCRYCYANSNKPVINTDPDAPMITGYPKGSEIITNRSEKSNRIDQISFF